MAPRLGSMALALGRVFAGGVALLAVVMWRGSSGCSIPRRLAIGNYTLTVQDPELGPIERQYTVAAAPNGMMFDPVPLVLAFHGQSQTPFSWTQTRHMQRLAQKFGAALVLPAGLFEVGDKVNDTTWNVGIGGDSSVCLDSTEDGNCKPSCRALGRCSRCSWSSCYSDVVFVEALLKQLEKDLCLDSSRYYLMGESNGAMFIHHLIQQLPGRFRAAAPVFGSPLLGYLVGTEYQLVLQGDRARETSVLQLHGRSDSRIPWRGGSGLDGWLYETGDRSLGVWAAVHGCQMQATEVATPYSGGPKNMYCFEFGGCSNGGRVMYCSYDGGHGDWPDQPRASELIWAFFEAASAPVDKTGKLSPLSGLII